MAKPDSYGRFFYRWRLLIIAVAIDRGRIFVRLWGDLRRLWNFLKRPKRSFANLSTG